MPPQVRPASAASLRLGPRPLSRTGPSSLSSARQKALSALTRTLVLRTSRNAAANEAQVDRIVALLADTSAHGKKSKREMNASYSDYERRVRVTHSVDVADALRAARERLESMSMTVAQQESLVEILQFLLLAANPPEPDTLANAEAVRSVRFSRSSLPTWAEIMNDPPFEGEHWLDEDDGSSSDNSLITDSSFSLLPSMDLRAQEEPASRGTTLRQRRDVLSHRAIVELLCRRQYWKREPQTFEVDHFSTMDPSSLYMALTDSIFTTDTKIFIHESDLVRECLMILQGYPSILGKDLQSSPSTRLLRHLSSTSLTSGLTRIFVLRSQLDRLRSFVNSYALPATRSPRPCRTLEAFASALDDQLAAFSYTCSQKEQIISRAHGKLGEPVPLSLLGMLHELRPAESLFTALDGLLDDLLVEGRTERRTVANLVQDIAETRTSAVAKRLLDVLYFAVQARLAVGDEVTADHLCRVLCTTAGPMWSMCASWLYDGMGLHGDSWNRSIYGLDGEFFVERHDLSPSSSDFWASGFTLRKGSENDHSVDYVPALFARLSQSLLATGKAIGLLRIMGVPNTAYTFNKNESTWKTIDFLLGDMPALSTLGDGWMASHTLDAYLRPIFGSVQSNLTQIIIDRCQLLQSLKTMESVSFMSRSDVMSEWCDQLFSKVDSSGRSWADFHFLNSALRDATLQVTDLDVDMLRLSYNGHRASLASSSVKGFDGLRIEYIAPFPLNYVFHGDAMRAYSRIFTLLVQTRRSQFALNNAFLNINNSASRYVHILRYHLSWILGVLVNFFSTILYSQVVDLDEHIKKASSFDEILSIHEQHLETINACFLLQRETKPLYASVVSILDLCLRFRTLARTIDRPISLEPKKRARRTTTRRRGPAFALSDSDSDTDSLPVDVADSFPVAPVATLEDNSTEKGTLIEMYSELVKEILCLRQGVELLAAQANPSAALFSSMVFGLQAWHV